jgi:ABC-type antimicrobial peptide transport system permease subunit
MKVRIDDYQRDIVVDPAAGYSVNAGACEVITMDAMLIGATFLGSLATAFAVQKALLGALLRLLGHEKAARQ